MLCFKGWYDDPGEPPALLRAFNSSDEPHVSEAQFRQHQPLLNLFYADPEGQPKEHALWQQFFLLKWWPWGTDGRRGTGNPRCQGRLYQVSGRMLSDVLYEGLFLPCKSRSEHGRKGLVCFPALHVPISGKQLLWDVHHHNDPPE